jgi:Flp pilus assembly protein TadD
MSPLSSGYQVTQRFFDHYDLTTLESSDFYPDGRDLGENYTYTSWLMNSCVRNGKFDCLHCHTSTGAFRFAGGDSDGACLPCHQGVADKGTAHSRHSAKSAGARCIGCHMPKTRFAKMSRSDHSMRPPTPAATIEFQSPNACNVCHSNKDAAWADAVVGKWYRPAYQSAAVERARLIDSARRRQWNRAPAMLGYLRDPKTDPVMTASLLRLLRAWDDPRKWPVYLDKLRGSSPLVRAAAAAGLADAVSSGEVLEALLKAAADEYRLVRVRAAASLGPVPAEAVQGEGRESLRKAAAELAASFSARPDDFTSQSNLGSFYLRRGEVERSVESFERAVRLRPDSVGTLVNASVAYSRAGRSADAERVLREAARLAPRNAAVEYNLGLLLAESNRVAEAEAALRAALAADPRLAPAAYNLAILVSSRDLKEAIELCRKAVSISPEARYIKALAQLLARDGRTAEARRLIDRHKR